MVGLVRHRQTKGPATDRPYLNHRATLRLHTFTVRGIIRSDARAFRDWVIRKYTKSHGRLANSRKAATPRTSAGARGADAQELHHARRIAAVERRACVPTEARAARGGRRRSVGC